MTTRLFERKGIDLVENILDDLMSQEVGFVIQGTGEERHHYLLQEIAARYPEQMGLVIGYSDELAHQIIAGADIFLMPSRYEPCGLDQLYCLRYGTIPVVRATGGLDETVQEYDPETKGRHRLQVLRLHPGGTHGCGAAGPGPLSRPAGLGGLDAAEHGPGLFLEQHRGPQVCGTVPPRRGKTAAPFGRVDFHGIGASRSS